MDDIAIVDGSRMHRDILFLKHHWRFLSEWEAVEQAVRFQAELSHKLADRVEVRLWGGPPFGELRWAPSVHGRQLSSKENFPLAFVTQPGGDQLVYLVENHLDSRARIYEIHDRQGNGIPLLGAELQSLSQWWKQESLRSPRLPTREESKST